MSETTTATAHTGIFNLIVQAGPMVQFVMLLLVLASVLCWGIIFTKLRVMKKAAAQNEKFLSIFWNSKSLDDVFSEVSKTKTYIQSPVAMIFKSGFKELQKLSLTERSSAGNQEIDNINRAMARASHVQTSGLERLIGWLATTASAAPFVGLFGTVWGIMNSFQQIGVTGSANLAVVAPGISEALIATAVGLAAAIPAVVGYNHFINQIRRQTIDMDCFSQDFLNIIQRGLMSEKPGMKKESK